MSFVTHKENGVTFHTSTLLENGAVRHGFSTRLGGVSEGVYASLNLRRHGNPPDAPDLVDENYRRFCAAVGVDTAGLALSRQVHEDTVRHVTAGDAGKGFSRPVDYTADALVTGIGPCCFETHSDVPDAMRTAFGPGAEAFITPAADKWRVDLKAINAWRLREAGVPAEQIDICPLCTACRGDLYWSHRKLGEHRGLQAALIGLPGGGTVHE